jgi:hypothetical protein
MKVPNCCGSCVHIQRPLAPIGLRGAAPDIYVCVKHGHKRVERSTEEPCHVSYAEVVSGFYDRVNDKTGREGA